MGHKNKEKHSLVYQVKVILQRMAAFGEKKHLAKKDGSYKDKIYSFSTFRGYLRSCSFFVKWCQRTHGCHTVEECRQYVDEYLTMRIKTCSAYTVKHDASAIGKLYGITGKHMMISTPPRKRQDITRSRKPAKRDRHFSEARNADLVSFFRSTGLRRNEAETLRGNQLVSIRGQYFIRIHGTQAKGGRPRQVPVIGDVDNVVRLMHQAGDGKVFGRIHSACDVHSYRAEYAAAMYRMYARTYRECIRSRVWDPEKNCWRKHSVYRCRGERCGEWYDIQAMLIVSRALGHNRISIIAGHYLHRIRKRRQH